MKLTQAEMDTFRRATLASLEQALTTDSDGMGGMALGHVGVLFIRRQSGAEELLNFIRTAVHMMYGPPTDTTRYVEEIREDPPADRRN